MPMGSPDAPPVRDRPPRAPYGPPAPAGARRAPRVTAAVLLAPALLAAALVAACGGPDEPPPEPPGVSEIAGCWSLELGDGSGGWRAADRPGLPGTLRLDEVRLDVRSPIVNERTYRAWSIAGDIVRDIPFHGWRTIAGDSLWAGHPGGIAGTELRLALGRDTMVGRLVTTAARPRVAAPSGPARLVRTACPPAAGAVGSTPGGGPR